MIKDWKTPMFELEFEEVRVKDPSARVENLYMVLKLSADEVITFLGNMGTEDLVGIVGEVLANNFIATEKVEQLIKNWRD